MVSRLKDTLLLIGDGESDRAKLRKIFDSTFNLLEAENSAQALMLLEQNMEYIAAVLADIPLSDTEGIRVLSSALENAKQGAPILLFITNGGTGKNEETAFSLGVTDVVYKPYTPEGVQRRLRILIDLYLHKLNLEKLVSEQNKTIQHSKQIMLDALSAIIEHRSTESGNHVLRIRRFTRILLEEVAASCPEYGLTPEDMDSIASAAALHDIGKISIPDNILNKPGKLTPEEFEQMKTHTTVGGELILALTGITSEKELRYAYNIALYHHERWDGRGYPAGLAGDDIPICAQVVGMADVFDALTTPRVYKPAYTHSKAINMILGGECGEFSPRLLACFKNVRKQFGELAHRYADGYSPKSDNITLPLPGPEYSRAPLNSLELTQVKYSSLLHYVNATVIEADMASRLYHVVYNPNPEFALSQGVHSDIFAYLAQHSDLHPDDAEIMAETQAYFDDKFFTAELHRRNFRLRFYSTSHRTYIPYDFTVLRVNTKVKEQRTVIILIRKAENTGAVFTPTSARSSLALYGLADSILRCLCNKTMTIDDGATELCPLTGYSEDEIMHDLNGSYLNLVHPEDRREVEETIDRLLTSGGSEELEYRLLCKDGGYIWVLGRSRFFTEEDGREFIYHSISDNSRARAAYEDYKYSIARNQLIIDQSGGIIFEWDLNQDTMYCSPKWEEHFGYSPVSENYGRQMGIATHFHPDDLPVVRGAIEQIKSNADTLCIDVRIADSNARYLWTRITATAYLDKTGKLTRIIGMLQDVDALKRAEMALRERAELDSLTKLVNKASTYRAISERLEQREDSNISAMLVIDLDNFKLVNDNFGHLYGDAVLSQVGAALKKLFRDNDIIGRIGGDEFLVFMYGIPDTELVENRCRQLLATFRDLFEKNAPGLNVSMSVGVSLIPQHGTGYTDLFRRADEALYMAKSQGKNTFVIFNPDNAQPMNETIIHTATRIDSDEQPGMADSSFVRYVFRRLYESSDTIGSIDDILSYVGQQLNVSRVYIFENNDDNTTCSNTFEWCNDGISPEKDSLQNISYITDIPGWPEVYDERGIFYCTDVSSLAPQFRDILEPQGIKSMLQCSIRDNGAFRGYVGFDECHVNRLWTQEQINLLEFLSQVLAMFLLKKRNQEKAMALADSLLTILDLQDDWLYVIDPETCELKFINAKCRTIASDISLGTPCYTAFMKRATRCKNCPALNCKGGRSEPLVIENPRFGALISSTAAEINWSGEKACLITCKKLSESK